MKNTKKIFALLLVAVMSLSMLAACGSAETEPEKPQGVDLSGVALTDIVDKIYEAKPIEMAVGEPPIDKNDPENVAYYIGLSDLTNVKEFTVSEAMIGSMAYSMIVVRVNDAAKAEETANAMLEGVNPAKWICVQADTISAGIYGDLIVLVMSDSELVPAADMIAGFKTVAGGNLDKELSK